jgi:hypothetical protein
MKETIEQRKRLDLIEMISTLSVEIFKQPMNIDAFDHLCDGPVEYLEDLLADLRFMKELSPIGRELYLKALMNGFERVGS